MGHDEKQHGGYADWTGVPVGEAGSLYKQLRDARHIFDSLVDALLVVDAEGRALLFNQTAEVLLGPGLAEMPPSEWNTRFSYLLPDSAVPPRLEDLPLMRALRGESVTRQEMHVSGEGIRNVWVSVTSRPIMDASGRFHWTYIVLRDVNLRKWSEERMLLHDRALGWSNEGIAILDAREEASPIIYVNGGFERLTGLRHDEVKGQGSSILFGPTLEDRRREALQKQLRKEEPVTAELEGRRPDGSSYWFRLSVTPVRDSAGLVTHYVAVLSDISERIETERKLKEATAKLRAANREVTWANERMRYNLEAAAKVQRALLPTSLPEFPCLRFAWAFEPAEDLSGDILNILQLDEEHVALYVLDVTGHGVASAMLSVTVSRLLTPQRNDRTLLFDRSADGKDYKVSRPGAVAERLSRQFPWDPEVGQFFTLVYGILNVRTRVFSYTSAGHPPPICLTCDAEHAGARAAGLPIGIGGGKYAERELHLEEGSRLYLYSDGMIEALSESEGLFGRGRLLEALRETRGLPLDESLSEVMHRVSQWRGASPVHDDVSLLGVEVDAQTGGGAE